MTREVDWVLFSHTTRPLVKLAFDDGYVPVNNNNMKKIFPKLFRFKFNTSLHKIIFLSPYSESSRALSPLITHVSGNERVQYEILIEINFKHVPQ